MADNNDDDVHDVLDDVELDGMMNKLMAHVRQLQQAAQGYVDETGTQVIPVDSAQQQAWSDKMHDVAILHDQARRHNERHNP